MQLRATCLALSFISAIHAAHAGENNADNVSLRSRKILLSQCLVSLIDDVEIPAEKAGVVVSIAVREGMQIESKSVVASIDSEVAVLQAEAARAEQSAVKAEADNELNVTRTLSVGQFAELEYQTQRRLVDKKAISDLEVERYRSTAEQARIDVDIAQFERFLGELKVRELDAKARLAEAELRRHRIATPLTGEVVNVFLRVGEWVEPGTPLIRLVRLDRLRVEGFVRFSDYAPSEVLGRGVIATIQVAGDGLESFSGRVSFVSPIIQPGGEYRIWAEVDNRRSADEWLLRPGLEAEMVID